MAMEREQRVTSGDLIPGPVQEVLDLFEAALSEQCFGSLNSESLRQLVEQVDAASQEMERRRLQYAAAREAFEACQESLWAAARQGVAYAKVFAEGQPELAARIDAMRLSQESKKPRRRRRAKSTVSAPSPGREEGEAPSAVELPLAQASRTEATHVAA